MGLMAILSSLVQAQTFSTGTRQNTLIELYTSQGCSSCPPAEKYLNSLKKDPGLWEIYIPIALHVDYWDYLGWKDRFASPLHTQRQRDYARVNIQRTIYTPGFFVNGEPWRRGIFNSKPAISKDEVGRLSVTLNKNQISAVFSASPNSTRPPLTLTVAVVGMGFKTAIEDGENEGSTGQHDFVNLKYTSKDSRDGKWLMTLPEHNINGASQFALVAWVSKQGDPRPIQAVGGYINK